MPEFQDELNADAYLMRRLALTRRARELPASVQFDLARAPIPDDQLEGVLGEFGVDLGNGWGIADVAHRLLSGQPDEQAVGDIRKLQENLKAQGYLPPSYNPSGVWNEQDYIALRQADRDALDAQRSGRSLLATPVATGMRLITDTLPSRVWQGVVGAAKGLAAQSQETAERAGLVGGAAGGAVIGGAIGSILPGAGTAIGAGLGAAAGGLIGFFGDLFGEEDDESNQEGWADILDALHPFNEYAGKDGVHQFFEDLSFVGTAASLASGVGIAARGVAGGVAAARGAVVASETAANPLMAGVQAAAPQVPGTLVRTPGSGLSFAQALTRPVAGSKATGALSLAIDHPTATGAVLGGFAGMSDPNAGILDVLEGAAFGAAGGLALRAGLLGKMAPGSGNWVKSMRSFMDTRNLMGRPIFKMANGIYTGAAAGSIGARLFSGELMDTEGPAPTTIAKSIRSTPLLETGMKIPIAGDLIDVASFVLYPTQLLPAKVGNLARSFDNLLGESALKPWMILAQHNDVTMTSGKARTTLREFFEPRKALYTKLHMDAAAEIEATRLMNQVGVSESQNAIAFRRTVAEVKKTMKRDKKYTDEVMSRVADDAEGLMAWALHHMGGDGPFLDKLTKYDEVETFLDEFQRDAKRLGTLVDEQPNSLSAIMTRQPGGAVRPVQPTVVPGGYVQENANRLLITQLSRERRNRQSLLERTERSLRGAKLKPDQAVRAHKEIQALKLDVRALDAQIDTLKSQSVRRKRLADEYHIVAARADTHTRKSLGETLKGFRSIRDDYNEAFDAARKVEDTDDLIVKSQYESALAVKQQEYETFVTKMLDDGLITPKQAEDVLRKPLKKGRASKSVENSIEAQSMVAARDIDLPPEAMRYLEERGYKPVVTGDEVFVTSEVKDIMSLMDVGNYSRRRNFFESIGLGTKQVKEENLYKITHAQMVHEVDQVLASGGVPLRGSAALRKLQAALEVRNSKAVVEFPVVGPIATALRFKADIRRLSPAEIEGALGDVRGFDSTMATEVYRALKRGAAFGQDFELSHPILAARQIGRANRVSGLPGFSQVIRSWHAKSDPFELKRGVDVLKKDDIEWNPPADLANSRERARVMAEGRAAAELAGIGEREIRESERFLDIMAESATRLRPDIYGSVDEFFRRMGVAYEHRYTPKPGALLQYRPDLAPVAPELQGLSDLAMRHQDAAKWYEESSARIAEIFEGRRTVLRDGREIDDYELFKELLAASSPQTKVVKNMETALRAITEYKQTGKTLDKKWIPGKAGPNIHLMIDDILKGHTIDRWAPMTAKELESVHGMTVVDLKYLRDPKKLTDEIGVSRRVRDADGGTQVRPKEELDSLREEMAKNGWGGHYVTAELIGSGRNAKVQILDGTHRLMLAEELGMKKIPVKWRLGDNDELAALRKDGVPVPGGLSDRTVEFLSKKKWIGGRPKVRNFYNNLQMSEDHVTVDIWMTRLFRGRDSLNAGEYAEIAQEVRAVADRIGYTPARTQAMLWKGFKTEYLARLREEQARLIAAGDRTAANKLVSDIRAADDAGSFGDAAKLPEMVRLIAEYEGSGGKVMLQRVEDSVRGSVQFGPDYKAAITLFETGGFDTLVHEGAHLLRQILPEHEVRWFEDHYGLLRQQGPEGASAEIRAIADEYHRKAGIPKQGSLVDQYPEVIEERARRIADAFEHQRPTPNDPETLAAYKAFALETMDQYDTLIAHDFKLIPWAGEGQPYHGAKEFIEDVRVNKRLYYFKTLQDDAFGSGKITQAQIDENPMLAYSGITVKDSKGNPYPQTYNDIFRAVHDIMAHAKEGVQTGARGEESAWRAHAAMYGDEARRAMTTETRGQNSWVNYGPHLRTGPEGRIPAKGEPGYVPPENRPFSDQKVMLLPEEFSKIEDLRWTPEIEERFAEDVTAFMMGVYKGKDTGALSMLRSALATFWARNRDGFLDAGVVPLGMHRKFNELFRGDIERLGLRRAGSAVKSKQVLWGTALGAAEGAITGDQGWEDTLRGALYGAGVGLGARAAVKKSYGYLPDALANLNMTLRYTMSFTFDLGRHMEQRMIAGMKYQLPSFGSPTKHLRENEWKIDGITVTGDEAVRAANQFYDEIHGTNYFAALQEFEQRSFQRGLLGFAPREYEVTQAFQMLQRGWSKEVIKERVAELGRYGLSRTNFERSVNFVFFPFSFQKKLLSTLQEFIFQAPGRNLLIHEGIRRYHDSLVDEQFHSLIEDRLPLLEQLWMVNNLAFGASLGRFFMEGFDDRRTRVGQAAQILSSFFVPSGSATPLQQAFGAAGDLSVGAFIPVVITGESLSRVGGIDGLDDIVRRYVPFVREIEKWAQTVNDQKVAALSPQHLTPYSQMQEYYEGRDAVEAQYSTLAASLGYSTVDGFLDSPVGLPFKSGVERSTEELRRQYPEGWAITTQFENQDAIDAAAIQDLLRKEDKSDGEEAFIELLSRQDSLEQMAQWLPEETAALLAGNSVRSYALQWVHDDRFAELYDRFMTRTYGPIRRVS